jgi:DTW domain-containing protein YfiP
MLEMLPPLAATHSHRENCYACFRPRVDCFCAEIPCINNQTEVLLLQHERERFHPFNTARIVHRALRNSSLIHDYALALASRIELSPHAGLLYPGEDAVLLSDLAPAARPKQLVVLDGTWHQTKTLVRDIPALRNLPRYKLTPTMPSQYRIRREPTADSLSTLEAVVAALSELEPQTQGLKALLATFAGLIDRQIERSQVGRQWRRHESRARTFRNIPLALTREWENLVVCYGESVAVSEASEIERYPVVWVAQRLGDGETFTQFVRPPGPLSDYVLHHLELAPTDFAECVSLDDLDAAWANFLRPRDKIVAYHQGTIRLLEKFQQPVTQAITLKAIDFHPSRRYSGLDEIVADQKLIVPAPRSPGRAGKRLAQIVALCEHLRSVRLE